MKIKTGLAKNIIRAQVVEALRWNTLNNMFNQAIEDMIKQVIITILMIIIVRS